MAVPVSLPPRLRLRAAAVGALALALIATAAVAQTPAGLDPGLAARLEKAKGQVAAGDLKAAHDTLSALTLQRDFARQPPEARGQILALDAEVATRIGLSGYASISARSAAKLPGQEGLLAQIQLLDAIRAGDLPGQRQALTLLATRYPATLAKTPDGTVLGAVNQQYDRNLRPDPAAEDIQGAMAETLLPVWRPQDPFISLDTLRLRVIRRHLAAGRLREAREIAAASDLRETANALRIERRYDALFADSWALPTPRAMSEASLIRYRAARPQAPRKLAGALIEAATLRELRAHDEALQVVDAALAQAERTPKAFDDVETVLPFLRQQRGILLDLLRRDVESKAAWRLAMSTTIYDQPNVNQLLNYANDLIWDDPKEALVIAERAEQRSISGYGQAVLLKARVCAQAALGQTAQAEPAYRRLLSNTAPGAARLTLRGAVCMKDLDQAARIAISALADPEERPRFVSEIQVDIPKARAPRTEREREDDANLRAVVLRPDVQAAMAPHARLISFRPEELWRP